MSEQQQSLEEILFELAVQKPDAVERGAFVDNACRDNPVLRAQLEDLLAAHFGGAGFLPQPAARAPLPDTIRETSPPAEAPAQMIGRYKLLEQIGEGGFGEVWMAEQREPVKRRVALKLIKLGMDSRQIVARFEAERQALAMMDHPNIAKIFDAGTTDAVESRIPNFKSQISQGRPYFVMELVRGIKITEYCDQNQLSTKDRLDLFIKVCQAIQHAHQKGIVHRDIKPSNILVTLHDGVPVPKVIDFGIAKATQQELTDKTVFTQFQQFIGTPAYISPEQAEMSGLDIDTRADIYSLGVLLYELLVGQTPFDAKEMMQGGLDALRQIIRDREPLRPSTKLNTLQGDARTTAGKRRQTDVAKLMHQLQGDLDWIVMKCLEKDRTRRYDSATGLAADLQRHLANEPIVARPPSAAYKFQKAWQRNKLAFTAVAAVAAALVAGMSVSTWQAIRATRAGAAEMQQRQVAESAQQSEKQARLLADDEKAKAQTAQKEAENAQQTAQQARVRADTEKANAEHQLYVANMNVAQAAWEQNNVRRVKELLDATALSGDRSFEWYYWQRQIHLASQTLRGHSGFLNSAAYSPDGKWVVTGSFDKTARIWDVATGKVLRILRGHRNWVSCVAVSPDGRRIATGGADETPNGDFSVRVWDVATGKELLKFAGHRSGISSVAFSPDGQRIASGSGNNVNDSGDPTVDHTVKVWDVATGKELLTFTGHKRQVRCVSFSPDGQRILSGSNDKTVKIWEAATGQVLLALDGQSVTIETAAFSPDGRRIVTNAADGDAKVWDAMNGKELLSLHGHKFMVGSAAFSSDGQHIVTGGVDQTAKVWDANSGEELFNFKGHSEIVQAVAFSPDGQRVVTASGNWMSTAENTAKIWDLSHKELLTLRGHTNAVSWVLFSPDGQRIVAGSQDGTARIWDAASGKGHLTLKVDGIIAGKSRGTPVAFSPHGERIITGSGNGTVQVWDAFTGQELLKFKAHDGLIFSVAISSDGQRIVTGSHDGKIGVWNAANGKERIKFHVQSGRVWAVAISPDDKRIACGSDGEVRNLRVFDAATGQELFTLKGHQSIVYSVAFSPDGRRIASAGADRLAKVWDAATGTNLFTLNGHGDQVSSVAFSPDGQRIVTSSQDRTAKVWEATTGHELLTLKGHDSFVLAANFSPDGQRIATGAWDGTVKLWSAATRQQVAAWTQEEKEAEKNMAQEQRERAAEAEQARALRQRDAGAIKQWLVLAPISLRGGQSGTEGLGIEQIAGEGHIRPKAGETISTGGVELKWREVLLEDYVIDFNALLGLTTTQSVAYAVSYIRSATEQHGVQLLVGSDDEAKVYLNGDQIHKSLNLRRYVPDEDEVRKITLNAGLNVLVFKVVNHEGDWKGSIRFTDPQGNPVHGIHVTLTP